MSARVLIVDDDRLSRTILRRTVESEGYSVEEAPDGADALKKIDEEAFDLVLLDLNMPGINGMMVLRSLNKSGRLPTLPVVVVTAEVHRERKLKALELGALDFTPKTLDPLELKCRLKNLLELGRLRQEAAQAAKKETEERLKAWIEASIEQLQLVLYQIPTDPKQGLEKHSVGDIKDLVPISGPLRFEALWTTLIHEEDRSRTENLFRRITSRQEICWHIVCRGSVGDKWFLHVGHFDADQNKYLGALLDVTETKQLETQFLQAQKMEAVGLLAGGIAHDFNNLLSAILAFSGFAQEGLSEGDQRRQDLGEVISAAERAAGLTRQLLTFSRRQTPSTEIVNLNERLTDLSKLLKSSVGEQISLEINLSPRPAVVKIDPVQFDQVVLNLAVNARDAMGPGGNLTIALETAPPSSEEEARTVQVLVSDTGRGMDAALCGRIFEPFFTTKKKGRGTGLGLATCAAIVEQADGQIEVESELGTGTTFRITLPLQEQRHEKSKSSREELPEGGGLEVLVVEDEASLRQVTRRILEQAGYLVYTASDGDEAIQKLDLLGNRLSALVTDVILPGASGVEVAAHAKRKYSHISVIFVTGYMDGRVDQESLQGAKLLWKPYHSKELLYLLAEVTDGSVGPRSVHSKQVWTNGIANGKRAKSHQKKYSKNSKKPENRERVLLLHSDEELRRVADAALHSEGIEVDFADSLSTARQKMKRFEFDAILTQGELSDGPGLEFLEEIGDTPAVYLSRKACPEELRGVIQRRVRAFLPLPVEESELRSSTRRVMRDGRLAKLRSRWLAARFGGEEFVSDMVETERLFRNALQNLKMEFQPVVRAGDKSIYGYEALARSEEPRFDTPYKLLAVAELLDQVVELGRAVRTAVKSVLLRRPDGLETIFINIHPLELNSELLGDKEEPLLPYASRIVLEVNERICLARGPRLTREIGRIRGLGYRLAVDDLGEGYSGLGSIAALRPNIVKLDRCLVKDIDKAPLKRDMVGTIIEMAHRAGIVVVAEGVESKDECETLEELGCDLLQGFFLAKPGAPFPEVADVTLETQTR